MAAEKRELSNEIILSLSEHLITLAGQEVKETGKINQETLNNLHFIYGHQLCQALELLDQKQAITSLITNDSSSVVVARMQSIYQVNASRNSAHYLCLPLTGYCSCPSFRYDVLVRDEVITCKHLLAVKLAVAMETYQERTITNSEFTAVIDNLICSFKQ